MPMYWQLKNRPTAERQRSIDQISALRKAIAKSIPRRTASDTLLLATWNVRDFDSNKFGHGPRLGESFHYIAEMVSAFDLVAMQEVNEDMRPFEKLMDLLGPAWRYIATDVTDGPSGNGERMVFLFDSNKVQFKHIAGEITLPKTALVGGEDQMARTPFLVRFQSGWFKFYLCTVHLYYGDTSGPLYERRVKEIDAIAGVIEKRAKEDGQNYILLGDMNVVSPTDATMKALKKHNLVLPADLTLGEALPPWVTNMNMDKSYDQIAFYVRKGELELGPSTPHAGVFNYYDSVFGKALCETYYPLGKKNGQWPDTEAARPKYYLEQWRTWQMSDHLPLWVELKIDFTDSYLKRIRAAQVPVDPPTPDAVDD
jgi:endonuclease/exonuclease/phosphatase family metal-dependent hydrolase